MKERLPRPIRALLSTSESRNSRSPAKPSRRAGPVGRTWVKVYDDITYMDDSATEDYVPVLGYSGRPIKIPDAIPLPKPPTPPPVQHSIVPSKASPTPSEISEYDNVSRNEVDDHQEIKKKQLQNDQELIMREILNKKMNQTSDQELIMREILKKEMNQKSDREVTLKDISDHKNKTIDQELVLKEISSQKLNEINQDFELTERPTVRKRDNNRYKGKKQKKISTPIAARRMINGYQDETNETFEFISYGKQNNEKNLCDVTIEDDYIVPEQPFRPKRGTKIYETVIHRDGTINNPDIVKIEPKQAEHTIKTDEPVIEPTRPTRGVKIYESIVCAEIIDHKICRVEIASSPMPPTNQQDKEISESGQLDEEKVEIDIKSTTVLTKPEKPKRGVKLYEDVIPQKLVEKSTDMLAEHTDSANTTKKATTSNDPPKKPSRGNKLYSSINLVQDMNKQTEEIKPAAVNLCQMTNGSGIVPAEFFSQVPVKLNEETEIPSKIECANKLKEEKSESLLATVVPPYAQVQKSRDNQLKQIIDEETTDTPPPIPPKKRSRHIAHINEVLQEVPPRPARHLKPRSRSTEIVSRPKRHKTENKENINDCNSNGSSPQIKPRRATSKTTVPPRRKKISSGDQLIAKMTIESGKVPQLIMTSQDVDSYENVTLQKDVRVNYRSRPLPPPPVTTISSVEFCSDGTASGNNTTVTILNNSEITPASVIASGEISSTVTIARSGKSESANETSTKGAECGSVHNTHVSCVSTADDAVESSASGDAVTTQSGICGKLDDDINTNLQNIETSFATLDTVLKSLKSYSNISPATSRISLNSRDLTSEQFGVTCVHGEPSLSGHPADNINIKQGVENDILNNINPLQETVENISIPPANTEVQVSESNNSNLNNAQKKIAVEVQTTSCIGTSYSVVSEAAILDPSGTQVKADEKNATGQTDSTTESNLDDQQFIENVATFKLTIGRNEPSNVSEISESVSLSSVKCLAERRVSMASENVLQEIEESCSEKFDVVLLSSESIVQGRKLSVGAENIATNIEESCIDKVKSEVECNTSQEISMALETFSSARKLSIAAENVTTNISELCEAVSSISPCESSRIASISQDHISENEGGRKISIAAETVIMEFIPETAHLLCNMEVPAEPIRIVPSDGVDAVSVAAVSVTVGEFADTVTNTSNDQKISSIAAETVESGEMTDSAMVKTYNIETKEYKPSGVQPIASANAHLCELIDSSNEPLGSSKCLVETKLIHSESEEGNAATEVKSEASDVNLFSSSTTDSQESSQTSITDEDSISSVVTKEELAARKEETVSVMLNETEIQENEGNQPSNTTEPSGAQNLDLNDGFSSISSQLEGINSVLESLVQNLSPSHERESIFNEDIEFEQMSQPVSNQLSFPIFEMLINPDPPQVSTNELPSLDVSDNLPTSNHTSNEVEKSHSSGDNSSSVSVVNPLNTCTMSRTIEPCQLTSINNDNANVVVDSVPNCSDSTSTLPWEDTKICSSDNTETTQLEEPSVTLQSQSICHHTDQQELMNLNLNRLNNNLPHIENELEQQLIVSDDRLSHNVSMNSGNLPIEVSQLDDNFSSCLVANECTRGDSDVTLSRTSPTPSSAVTVSTPSTFSFPDLSGGTSRSPQPQGSLALFIDGEWLRL